MISEATSFVSVDCWENQTLSWVCTYLSMEFSY